MNGKFIGIKRMVGESKKDGKKFDFSIACIVTDFTEKEVEKFNAAGNNVHAVSVPDHYKDVLTEKNLGKTGEFEFYFAGRGENLAYCRLDETKK